MGEQATAHAKCFGLLLLPGYAMEGVAAVIDVLASLNETAGVRRYAWQLITLDGGEVASDSGLTFHQQAGQTSIKGARLDEFDVLMLCGGYGPDDLSEPCLESWLQEVAACGIRIGGLGSAVPLLARCGLLDGYRCSVAGRQAGPLRERFPAVDVNTKVFTIDGDRFSCAGGSSSIDMMLNVLVDEVGFERVASVAETLGCERIRSHVDDQQCRGMDSERGSSVLNEAIALMRNNMDDPVSISEIARYTERSRRQIERLFKKHLGCNPSRYYMNIRLNHARKMLLNTAYSIKEIGAFCGFISIPYFSKCFREQHGATPSAIRFDRDPVNKIPYYLLNIAAVGLSYGMEAPKGFSANYIRDGVAA